MSLTVRATPTAGWPGRAAQRGPTACRLRRVPATRRSAVCAAGREVELIEPDRRGLLLGSAALAAGALVPAGARAESPESIYDLSALQYGEEVSFDRFRDQVIVVVNVNVNYPGLRELYNKYHDLGFNLVAFPCNQFGGQAPGSSDEERKFAWKKFGFEFPVMDKIEVNGGGTHPIYRVLKSQQPSDLPSGLNPGFGEKGRIAWNYTKFLVDRQGRAAARFGPAYDPLKFEGFVRSLLANQGPLPRECLGKPDSKGCRVPDSALSARAA